MQRFESELAKQTEGYTWKKPDPINEIDMMAQAFAIRSKKASKIKPTWAFALNRRRLAESKEKNGIDIPI